MRTRPIVPFLFMAQDYRLRKGFQYELETGATTCSRHGADVGIERPTNRYACSCNGELFRVISSGKLVPMAATTGQRSAFWEKHRGLVWSNPQADDSVHIRAALVRPRFSQLLEIVLEFGLERVRAEWDFLRSEPTHEVERARSAVERILNNIQEGFRIAAAGN
jgi:hypothetical protein